MQNIKKLKLFLVKTITTVVLGSSIYVVNLLPTNAEDAKVTELEDLFHLSLEELFNVEITSTSYFLETPLDVASTVTVIQRNDWEKRGARRLDDAVSNMPGFTPLPHFLGIQQWVIRGSVSTYGAGVQTLWDGVSINTYPVVWLSYLNLIFNSTH